MKINSPGDGIRPNSNHSIATLALAFALWVTGCTALDGVNVGTGVNLPGGIDVGANTTIGQGQNREKPSKKTEQPAKESIKLYVFDCGRLRMEDVSMFGLTNAETSVRELFVPCYLIEHPTKGRLLWDAGLPPALAGKGEQPLGEGTSQEYTVSLVDQLARMQLRPRDIDFVAFSHMHFDHVGSANAFGDSTLLIQEAEYDAAFKRHEENTFFEYEHYRELAESTKTLLTGDHDVFGDGSAQLISAPGHTPGHQVLFLRLDDLGPLVLSGDLYHFEASRRLRIVPEFNTDKAQTLNSMDKVEDLIRKTKATLWIEHNLAQAQTLKLAPEFYQ
ncbi:MAG: N-acyl homoserine lactonase family protein [Pseudomonadales bacterium]